MKRILIKSIKKVVLCLFCEQEMIENDQEIVK